MAHKSMQVLLRNNCLHF